MDKHILGFHLICVTDRRAVAGGSLENALQELMTAGIRAIQIREKDMPDGEFRRLVERVKRAAEKMPVQLTVNGRMSVAREFGTGLHVPEGSDIGAARRELGPNALIGASVHSVERAKEAERDGATFVMFGPVFPPISKSLTTSAAGLDELAGVCEAVRIPVVAVGGVTPSNARGCIDAGAAAVASIGALLSAPNPRSALLDFMRALGRL